MLPVKGSKLNGPFLVYYGSQCCPEHTATNYNHPFLKGVEFQSIPVYILKRQYFVGRSIFYNTVNSKKLHQNENNGDKLQNSRSLKMTTFQCQLNVNIKSKSILNNVHMYLIRRTMGNIKNTKETINPGQKFLINQNAFKA